MKKTILWILLFSLLLSSLTGCMFDTTYSFDQPTTEISSIEIVSLKYHGSYYEDFEEIVICKIEDVSQFLDDFNQLEYNRKFSPNSPPEAPTAIKVTYKDGAIEAITPYGTYCSVHMFWGGYDLEEQQFYDLIAKYAGEEQRKLEYNFSDKQENITAIQIVKVGEYLGYRQWTQPAVICDITDNESFLKDFSELDCYWDSHPTRITDYSQAIQITYATGYREIIASYGQLKFWGEDVTVICPTQGHRVFDQKQFGELIYKYKHINSTEATSLS